MDITFYVYVILFIVNFDPYVIANKKFRRSEEDTMRKKKNKKTKGMIGKL